MSGADERIGRNAQDAEGWRRLAAALFRPFRRTLDHEHLMTFSDAELADIGLRRWEIDDALRTGRRPK